MIDERLFNHVTLDADDVAFLKKLTRDLPILADICRADLLLYAKTRDDQAITIAQAMPHSASPLYEEDRVGYRVRLSEQPEVLQGLKGAVNPKEVYTVTVRGATIARRVFPVRNTRGRIIAVMAMDSYWFAHERHRRRSKVFQEALEDLRAMVLRGELCGGDILTPFGERDGIVYVSADRRIRYMSGVASSLYRHLGYRDSLIGRRVSELDTIDQEMVNKALSERCCLERQEQQYGQTWIRRALPVLAPEGLYRVLSLRWRYPGRGYSSYPQGVLILIHDLTEQIQAQQELESRMRLVREVHHRVKNNLQTIAALLRMQARRASSEEAKAALTEGVNRILTVAVVHEFLSQNIKGTINLQEIAHRIVGQAQQALVDPDKRIRLTVKGPDIWLPAERATQCALVINELVQNALEHGIAGRDEGIVEVELIDHGAEVSIVVTDDGQGLPEGFDLDTSANLGLRIVRSMAEKDLRGRFTLHTDSHGTTAVVCFDKSNAGGN